MNQKPKLADRAWIATVLFSIVRTHSPAIMILIAIVVSPVFALAQNGWTPPNDPGSGFYSAAKHPSYNAAAASHQSFPEAPFAFDPGVRTANLEVNSSLQGGGASSDSNSGSTAAMLSNLKQAASEKVTQLAAAFNQNTGWMKKIRSIFGQSDISRMLGSLCLVVGIYFAFVWVIRKISPAGNRQLPEEVIEVIGQVPFGPRKSLQLVRLGSKLLLLINSAEGTQPIGEITDPNEVAYLTALCPGKRTSGATAIRQAANRLVPPQPSTFPSTTPATSQTPAQSNSNLANILQALEKAAKQGGAVFEA